MSNLFNKIAVMTDIHFGLKNNSPTHNRDCEDFIDWFIDTAKQHNCDTGLCCGDWHNHRNNLNIATMNASIRSLEKLGQAFDNFYFFPGNHDLYFKENRNIYSVEFAKFIPGVTVIDQPTTIGNVVLCPWLVGDEWKSINKLKGKYIFGHFELPSFMMNAMVAMPDHNEIQLNHFKNFDYGFSGHFHKRQQQKNMIYIGNCFPHNYADTWDDDRGMMILPWDQKPEFYTWPEQPTFRTVTLSQLIDNADNILKPKQNLRVSLDIDISFEEAGFIKETFIQQYNLREITLIPGKREHDVDTELEVQSFENIDTIVSNQILSIESDTFDVTKLLTIYNGL